MALNRHFLAAATLALLATSAHAGRPLVTEDAGVLGKGECEWESFLASARISGSPTVNGWDTQVGCGVLASSQVAFSYGLGRTLAPRSGRSPAFMRVSVFFLR